MSGPPIKSSKEAGVAIDYQVGTMIEIPRAALTADEVAREADFFSFGTNDLTQMAYGLSRDDAGKILDAYYETKIFENDPTARLDLVGVGRLMKIATESGRETQPGIKLGICGEHGGDPGSIEFCHQLKFNYVSCSPFRVPIARLAAAQSAIKKLSNTYAPGHHEPGLFCFLQTIKTTKTKKVGFRLVFVRVRQERILVL